VTCHQDELPGKGYRFPTRYPTTRLASSLVCLLLQYRCCYLA